MLGGMALGTVGGLLIGDAIGHDDYGQGYGDYGGDYGGGDYRGGDF